MRNCNPMTTPLQANEKLCKNDKYQKADQRLYKIMIGSLLYLTTTRRDIIFAASNLSRSMQNPSNLYLGAAKRLLKYVKGTTGYGMNFQLSTNPKVVGYTDSD